MSRASRCVRCGEWVRGTRECQVCRVCSMEEKLGELSDRLIKAVEEIGGIKKEVGECQRGDLVGG